MSGKPAGRLGDVHSGHSCFPPSPCTKGSNNVSINGKPAMRVTDTFVPHCCGPSCHTPYLGMGSSTVIINGLPAGRLGDTTTCGASVMVGSGNVLIG